MFVRRVGRRRMDVQLAEAPAERLVLVVRELLVAEKDHQIVHQGVMNLLENLVAERPGEVDAGDLGADRRRQLADFDSLVGHWLFLTVGASLRENVTMSDTIVLRAATAVDAAGIAAAIAASFEQYRGKLEPESGAFRETAEAIAAELARDCGAIIAERNGRIVGCVVVRLIDDDLYFGRLAVVPEARGQ